MPKLPENRVPSYRLHKQSGQAVVTLNGKDVLLGRHDTSESREKYSRVIGEWLVAGRRVPARQHTISIAEIVVGFRRHARAYYRRPDGSHTSEVNNYDQAVRPLLRLYARTPANEFGPLRLKATLDEMVRTGWCRSNINKHLGRLKHLFRWATENELIPPHVYQGIRTVAGLRVGRTDAAESEPVRPVEQDVIDKTLPHLSRTIRAMVELQLLTGMRPGEVCAMRDADLDVSGTLWVYRPGAHKTMHHGHTREIYIGPRAQQVLAPFRSELSTFLFSPARAEHERLALLRARRMTPLNCGNRPGSNRRAKPKRQPGERYDVAVYRRAIARACDAAFPPPAPLARLECTDADAAKSESALEWRRRLSADQRRQLGRWRAEHRWHPHQLRHNAGTNLRREYGLEAAQVILGHRTLSVTQIYAERNVAAAMRIMAEVG